MKTDDFDYELPEHLIAQTPLKERDGSRISGIRNGNLLPNWVSLTLKKCKAIPS